jgi:glutathione-regulated potassium-efflux system ancillary protein KefF
MSETLLIHAHPFHQHSHVTRDLLTVFETLPNLRTRSLYELYPDFDIDVHAEQEALLLADNIVWLAPVHWYSLPSLLKHWIDTVLTHGWAYGGGVQMLRGKRIWWVASAGGSEAEYTAQGSHFRPFDDFIAPIEGTARYCGMQWLPPFIVHGYSHSEPSQQTAIRAQLRELCQQYLTPDSEVTHSLKFASPLVPATELSPSSLSTTPKDATP